MIIGTSTLSLIGNGKASMVMAIAAPRSARGSGTKNVPARNAKRKPAMEPSQVLPLLKGRDFVDSPPKIEAVLSPKQNIAMAAPPGLAGNIIRVISIPNAK